MVYGLLSFNHYSYVYPKGEILMEKLTHAILQTLCNLFIKMTPVLVSDSACLSYFGEPEVPESLK